MRLFLFILRFIFGIVFILSGFFKLTDPVGTGLIVKEYLNAMHFNFLSFGAVYFGMALSLLEFLVGMAVFMKMRIRVASFFGLIMTAFFTFVTLILVIFNPIQDCGCFGEAIHLSNMQSFIKNLVLLACIVPIYIFRKSFRRVASIPAEWIFLGIYGVAALLLSSYSLVKMPVVEFGNFRVGSDISVKMDDASQNLEFETLFIYEKEGVQKEFSLDNLPDSTWTFIDSKDASKKIKDTRAPFDFSVMDKDGNYVTNKILFSDKAVIAVIVTDLDGFLESKASDNLFSLSKSVNSSGGVFLLITSESPYTVSESGIGDSIKVAFSDYKTVISMHRSNGGVIYINDAIVVKKWAKGNLSPKGASRIIKEDADMVMSKDIIKQQLIWEISIVVIFLSIIMMRYICGMVYGQKRIL